MHVGQRRMKYEEFEGRVLASLLSASDFFYPTLMEVCRFSLITKLSNQKHYLSYKSSRFSATEPSKVFPGVYVYIYIYIYIYINIYIYMCVCVCLCVSVCLCVCARVRACVRVPVCLVWGWGG